jgi:hypothetical protein
MAKKTELKGKVMLLYNEKGTRAFNVNCDEGKFTIIDYTYEPLDREIYWENDTTRVKGSSEEFKVAAALVDGYIRGVHAKLSKEAKKAWPLV